MILFTWFVHLYIASDFKAIKSLRAQVDRAVNVRNPLFKKSIDYQALAERNKTSAKMQLVRGTRAVDIHLDFSEENLKVLWISRSHITLYARP